MSEQGPPFYPYSPEFLAGLTDGELADHLFNAFDLDPDGESGDAPLIEAEVKRRGLTWEQLGAAWKGLGLQSRQDGGLISIDELAKRYSGN